MAPFGDVAPALELCRAAAGGAGMAVVRALALDLVAGLVPVDGALWADVDGAGDAPPVLVVRRGPGDGDEERAARFARDAQVGGECPAVVLGRGLAGGDGSAVRLVEHVAEHPGGVGVGLALATHVVDEGSGLCIALPGPAGHRVGLAVHRAVPFDPVERARIDAVVPLVACAVSAAARHSPTTGTEVLTAREAAVLRSVATGMSDKQAAHVLGVSPRTVGKHLEHIYAKLGVAGRTEAAAHVWSG